MFRIVKSNFKKNLKNRLNYKKKRNLEHYLLYLVPSLKRRHDSEWFYHAIEKAREYQANIERVKAEEDVKNNYNPDGRARLIAMLKDR